MKKNEYEVLKEAKKVILAYSGGLDTSVMVTWLRENGAKEVICVSVDLGQVEDAKAMEEKALKSGAEKFYNINVEDEFIEEYGFKSLMAGAKYENVYLLGTAIARPLISKVLVDVAKKRGSRPNSSRLYRQGKWSNPFWAIYHGPSTRDESPSSLEVLGYQGP